MTVLPPSDRAPDQPRGGTSATVSVRYFAGAQAAAGVPAEKVTLAAPATVGRLVDELVHRHGDGLARVLAASTYIVDEVVATVDRELADGAVVDVLPPFAGG
ncbi:MAG TPA: MoaD/ThiS family protein [Kineosporiaceae bacterium]